VDGAARREVPEDGAGAGTFDGVPPGWLSPWVCGTHDGECAFGDGCVYADLASHWQPGEIVEITMVIGLFNYFNRFNDALRVEITR